MQPSRKRVHRKAGRQDTKRQNLRTILSVVASAGTSSRAEVARATSLTRATVSTLVGDLIDDGLLVEVGHGESAGGKPPTLIEVNRHGRDLIVADLSTVPFTGTVVNLLSEPTVPTLTAEQTGDHAADLEGLLDRLIEAASNPILGIGLASPGVISDDGVVVEAANLGWHGFPLADRIGRRTGHPVTVMNDAHASAVAARRQLAQATNAGTGTGTGTGTGSGTNGGERPGTDLLLLRIAGGVGAGVILDGELHLGGHRAAGEIGHAVLDPDGLACRCGNRGCVETIGSANAIHTRITGAEPTDVTWSVEDLERSAGKDVVDAELAIAGTAIGTAVSYLVNALDISQIVVSMQPAGAASRVADAIEAALVDRVLPALRGDLEVRTIEADDLAMVGVASTVIEREFGLNAS